MKKVFFFLLITTGLFAQTVYEVVPGVKGNQLELNVVNESKGEKAIGVEVTITNAPKSLEFIKNRISLGDMKANEEKGAVFEFDVKRTPAAKNDTIRFSIKDKNGEEWEKKIIVKYSMPTEFKLEQNYPNPFNPTTLIEYSIVRNGRYNITVYNILGQQVQTLIDEVLEAGYYKTTFNANRLASGLYIYRLSGDRVNIAKKMMVMK